MAELDGDLMPLDGCAAVPPVERMDEYEEVEEAADEGAPATVDRAVEAELRNDGVLEVKLEAVLNLEEEDGLAEDMVDSTDEDGKDDDGATFVGS